MNAIKRIRHFVVDTVVVAMVAFIALFVYAMYTSDGAMLDALTCNVQYDSKFGETACMFVKSTE